MPTSKWSAHWQRVRHLAGSLKLILTHEKTYCIFEPAIAKLAQGEMQGLDLQAMIFHNYTVFLKMREKISKNSLKSDYIRRFASHKARAKS